MQLPLNLPQSIRINTNIQTVAWHFALNTTNSPAGRFNFFHGPVSLLMFAF
jgi:hypothetical protein